MNELITTIIGLIVCVILILVAIYFLITDCPEGFYKNNKEKYLYKKNEVNNE